VGRFDGKTSGTYGRSRGSVALQMGQDLIEDGGIGNDFAG
jgi:hypothetical protein